MKITLELGVVAVPNTSLHVVVARFSPPAGETELVGTQVVSLPEERSREAYAKALNKGVSEAVGTLTNWSSGSDYRNQLAAALAVELLTE